MSEVPQGLSHLPEWAWRGVGEGAATVGFPPHFFLFIISLVMNYPLGILFSRIPPSSFKHVVAAVVGLFLGWLIYGYDFIHCIIVPVVAYALMFILPDSPALNTMFSIGYLSYHCFVSMWFNYMGYRFDFTMALMVTAVKTSIVAFSYSDGRRIEKGKPLTGNEKVDKVLLTRTLKAVPSVLHYASYILFFPALLTGPCFGIKHYLTSMETPISKVCSFFMIRGSDS
jgi:lysophospholipid acyltransferase